MTVTPCSDLSPADWLGDSELAWSDLVCFGPSGFPAYVRLRFLPDPSYEGQSENDVDVDFDAIRCATDQWQALCEVLAVHTSTPEDCYFCLWDGWGDLQHCFAGQPKLGIPSGERHPARAYYLFRGALPTTPIWNSPPLLREEEPQFWPCDFRHPHEPAFVWPADRAWCVANDVDPHWAGIGADVPAIERVLADPRLDAVGADPADSQPAYR